MIGWVFLVGNLGGLGATSQAAPKPAQMRPSARPRLFGGRGGGVSLASTGSGAGRAAVWRARRRKTPVLVEAIGCAGVREPSQIEVGRENRLGGGKVLPPLLLLGS